MEQVVELVYLGGLVMDDDECIKDIKRHAGLTSVIIRKLSKILKSKNVTSKIKTKLHKALVLLLLLYGS